MQEIIFSQAQIILHALLFALYDFLYNVNQFSKITTTLKTFENQSDITNLEEASIASLARPCSNSF
jgi:hypothetical protein